jgi:hypothetical protein
MPETMLPPAMIATHAQIAGVVLCSDSMIEPGFVGTVNLSRVGGGARGSPPGRSGIASGRLA